MSEFVLDIGLCRVLLAVHWFGSDIGLRQLSDIRLLVAFSLCSVSVVFVCIGLDQIMGFVGYL